MAIYHCSMKPVARSSGRSAVGSAAYRSGDKLRNERDGVLHDYTGKSGILDCGIILPEGVSAEWALNRERLWNEAERVEKRGDARTAREFEIALPHELDDMQRQALTREFAQHLANRYGAAVDYAIHEPSIRGDERNYHAHLLMTTRKVERDGLGEKTDIERENKWLLERDRPTSHMQLKLIRQDWQDMSNRHLALAGHDVQIDHRSYAARGFDLRPTEHMGVAAHQMEQRGVSVTRARLDEAGQKWNAESIVRKPDQVLDLLTAQQSVFDRHDVARVLNRYISEPQDFQNAFASVMGSKALVELQGERAGQLARYSTREMVELEAGMAREAQSLSSADNHGVRRASLEQAFASQDQALQRATGLRDASLSEEQRLGVAHITGAERLALVEGFAGAGKSTMLAAAREAWERDGYRVYGAALSGKAAEGLEAASGIESRTLASWQYGWQQGRGMLQKGDVLVIDEAGMIGSRQMASFVSHAHARGAKLVLVGDHEQLQAIGAGAAFRSLSEQAGSVRLSDIRRQKHDWQREASSAFARKETQKGLEAYERQGDIRFVATGEAAKKSLVADYMAHAKERPDETRLALTHRKRDVKSLNSMIREARQARGELGRKDQDITLETARGSRSFARGDRIILLENNRDLGVKNGMLGTVKSVSANRLDLQFDGKKDIVSINPKSYQSFDHGYATTIHKSQGATIDRAFVLASQTMDRHLTYVGMTRHRERATLYADRETFKDRAALYQTLSRSGAKETTLDYGHSVKARRDAEIGAGRDGQTRGERAPIERRREPLVQSGHNHPQQQKETHHKPLIPAMKASDYTRSIEEVARAKTNAEMSGDRQGFEKAAHGVYQDKNAAMTRLHAHIEKHGLLKTAAQMEQQPEAFGELHGKKGLFGENSLRKQARMNGLGFARQIKQAAEKEQRLMESGKQQEAWQRKHKDSIEIPNLSPQSEKILRAMHQLSGQAKADRLTFMQTQPAGQKALSEARSIHEKLEQRFGQDYQKKLEHKAEQALQKGRDQEKSPEQDKGQEKAQNREHIASITDLVAKTQKAEQQHAREQQREQERSQEKDRGLEL